MTSGDVCIAQSPAGSLLRDIPFQALSSHPPIEVNSPAIPALPRALGSCGKSQGAAVLAELSDYNSAAKGKTGMSRAASAPFAVAGEGFGHISPTGPCS